MEKNIDESWKESVEKEQGEKTSDTKKGTHYLEANFSAFVSSIAMEALIFLGEIQNPITKKKEENLVQARYIIDVLSVLKEKTKGNLSAEESNIIDNILYELRSKFVSKDKKTT